MVSVSIFYIIAGLSVYSSQVFAAPLREWPHAAALANSNTLPVLPKQPHQQTKRAAAGGILYTVNAKGIVKMATKFVGTVIPFVTPDFFWVNVGELPSGPDALVNPGFAIVDSPENLNEDARP
ncbi:hypothetical protein TWF481_011872 [Arthrobotrys musiformis]|uniref:Uncharacterized protein n=1 Tax=Arthrobotrys musiformis TaxID=47236 RepID=A0AAV9VVI3_9PEZI